MTDAQISALVQELRGLDLSSKPALQALLRRLERLTDRNDRDAARYPTPPPAEGYQVDFGEKNALDSQPQRNGRGRKASAESASWRCQPQGPSDSRSHELERGVPMQSVFALDTAGAAARATIKQFESRHSTQAGTDVGVDAGQLEGEHLTHGDDVDIKIEEGSNADMVVETVGLRKSKRRRTRVGKYWRGRDRFQVFLCCGELL
ncbi:hypothetical protein LXA43DRAFT_1066579 [Ganoderma leucocontextum]|nr:hypothetical protein LXA43DRAFT_1066579 [Ganoderma leucocontextum]